MKQDGSNGDRVLKMLPGVQERLALANQVRSFRSGELKIIAMQAWRSCSWNRMLSSSQRKITARQSTCSREKEARRTLIGKKVQETGRGVFFVNKIQSWRKRDADEAGGRLRRQMFENTNSPKRTSFRGSRVAGSLPEPIAMHASHLASAMASRVLSSLGDHPQVVEPSHLPYSPVVSWVGNISFTSATPPAKSMT